MASQPAARSSPQPAVGPRPPERGLLRRLLGLFALRKEIPLWQELLFGALCIAVCYVLWWLVTRGEPGERILPLSTGITSPEETFASFRGLWFDQELSRNLMATLQRVILGFGLAAVVGIPLGVLCGCFSHLHAFFNPLSLFGRNIPVAALIPLTYSLFHIGELQKVMFIFIACVAFVLSDTARAIREVGTPYIDTAYTLGASRRQVILKVLIPLAMPSIFNSLRLLFGLAFGYIMLAETIKIGNESGGIGHIINTSQRIRTTEASGHIILILLIIPVVALAMDRILFWVQKELFPYRYGGSGILHQGVRVLLHCWDDLKAWLWKGPIPAPLAAPQSGELPGDKP
jgi:NitT/TauT family transport system permease protein